MWCHQLCCLKVIGVDRAVPSWFLLLFESLQRTCLLFKKFQLVNRHKLKLSLFSPQQILQSLKSRFKSCVIRSNIFDVILNSAERFLGLDVLVLFEASVVSLWYWSEIRWHFGATREIPWVFAYCRLSWIIKPLISICQNEFWGIFFMLRDIEQGRLAINMNIWLWWHFLVVKSRVCNSHEWFIEHVFFYEAIISCVVI